MCLAFTTSVLWRLAGYEEKAVRVKGGDSNHWFKRERELDFRRRLV